MRLDRSPGRPSLLWSSIVATLLAMETHSHALQLDQLGAQTWKVQEIVVHGNEAIASSLVRAEILTPERPWYAPWRSRPEFDPITFESDLLRLHRLYERDGWYRARIVYDLEPTDAEHLAVHVWIEEHDAVVVKSVEAGVKGAPEMELPATLPIATGQRFTEEHYQQGELALKEFFLRKSYAHVIVEHAAKVDPERGEATVSYLVDPGPETTFGETRVDGADTVGPDIVPRELEYHAGERFSLDRIEESRDNLLKLDLFSSAAIGWETQNKPTSVPMIVKVDEKPPRELSAAVGYGTDDKFRTQLRWTHYDWLGGARQLSLTLKYSSIKSSIGALFTQPHFLSQHTSGILEFTQDRDDEDNYALWASRFLPRVEHRFGRQLTAHVGYKVEVDKASEVDDATVDALGGVKKGLLLSGPTAGLVWNTTKEPFDPHEGSVVTVDGEQIGSAWGGDFRFWKASLEGKRYDPLPWSLVLADRVKLAFADALGREQNLPIWERLYSGGEKSVRGYGRRRLGPRSAANDPIGGRSLIEGSLELRRTIWDGLGGALFLDAGQVSRGVTDVPIDDLRYGTGFALFYQTPVGPLRFDVGFPLKKPSGDAAWQLYFSIGQFY